MRGTLRLAVAGLGLVGLAAAGAALGVRPAVAAGPGKVVLKYKFRPGEVLTYAILQENTTLAAGTKAITSNDMKMTYTTRKAGPDGSGEVEVRILSMDMDGEGAGASTMKSMVSELKKMWFDMKILPNGKVLSAKPHDAPPGMEALGSVIEGAMSGMTVFSDLPVGPGDKWADEKEVPLPMGAGPLTLKMKTGYVLRSFKVIDGRKHALIDATITMTSDGEVMSGVSLKMSGDGSSVITFDVERGVMTASDMSTRTRMVMSGTTMSGTTIDTDSKGTMKLSK